MTENSNDERKELEIWSKILKDLVLFPVDIFNVVIVQEIIKPLENWYKVKKYKYSYNPDHAGD